MTKFKLILTLALFAAMQSAASAAAPTAEEISTQLQGTISTYGGALTAVVVAGVVLRFVWKWIKSVR